MLLKPGCLYRIKDGDTTYVYVDSAKARRDIIHLIPGTFILFLKENGECRNFQWVGNFYLYDGKIVRDSYDTANFSDLYFEPILNEQ